MVINKSGKKISNQLINSVINNRKKWMMFMKTIKSNKTNGFFICFRLAICDRKQMTWHMAEFSVSSNKGITFGALDKQ